MNARRIGAVLALIAAILVLMGTFTPRWLTAPAPADGGIGLAGVELCSPNNRDHAYGGGAGPTLCVTRDWDELLKDSRGDKDLRLLSQAALVAVLGSVAVVGLLGYVGVVGLVSRRRLAIGTILAIIGSLLALGGAIGTVVLLRRFYRHDHYQLGYSLYVYCTGCVAGVISSVLTRRR